MKPCVHSLAIPLLKGPFGGLTDWLFRVTDWFSSFWLRRAELAESVPRAKGGFFLKSWPNPLFLLLELVTGFKKKPIFFFEFKSDLRKQWYEPDIVHKFQQAGEGNLVLACPTHDLQV